MEIISSSEDEKSKPSTSKCETQFDKSVVSTGKDTIFLTSDSNSEYEEDCGKVLRKKKQKCYGLIDLLTSESETENTMPNKKRRVIPRRAKVEVKPEEILTSDDDVIELPKSQKRKIEDNDYKPEVPKKKVKEKEAKEKNETSNKTTKMPTKANSANTKNINKNNGLNENIQPKKPETNENTYQNLKCQNSWTEHELLAEQKSLDPKVAQSVIKLFKDGNTIPFIARYRRNVTGDMTPEQLRDVRECYDELCNLKSRMVTVSKAIVKTGKMDEKLQKAIHCARSLDELEHIYEPFKSGAARTLAERAKELGLEEPALHLLNNSAPVNLNDYVNPKIEGLKTVQNVEKGLIDIIYSVISTDAEMLAFLRELRSKTYIMIETQRKAKDDEKRKQAVIKKGQKVMEESKFETYFNFKCPLRNIKPHQVLAINRGESQQILSVKVDIPHHMFQEFSSFCYRKWVKNSANPQRADILNKAIQETYKKRVQPLVSREIRSELKQKAEKASCEVFGINLKHLLLASPLKGKPILGIDPGYSNGCKVALISQTGVVLDHGFIYPHKYGVKDRGEGIIKDLLIKHKCSLIAIGNGTACRETEEWITELIQIKYFSPLDVHYTIVCEDGASIYSCSSEAKKEFPDLYPNIISAISLARRVQDPMAELVKIEPQHLGIGMYQHDLKKKKLDDVLNEVVSECVSFVGVDLNTASQCLLRRVAGLTDKRATQIIEYRTSNGPFINRRELLKVFGIGERYYEQCAGFLRVGPVSIEIAEKFYKNPKTTKLDCTIIHPESYSIAQKIISKLKLKVNDIGEETFIKTVKDKMPEFDFTQLADELKVNKETVQLVLDALSKPLNYDLRVECSKEPLFKKELTRMEDLTVGDIVTGRIQNVTHFGSFVDIGVGSNGLIHISKANGFVLQIGDKIEVKIINFDIGKKRINLEALKKL